MEGISKKVRKKLKIKRGKSYGRLSVAPVGDDGKRMIKDDGSLEVQKNRCYKMAANKSDDDTLYEIDEFIADAGVSGKDTNRPGFQRLCRLIAEKKIDFVIATDLTRLSRNTTDFLNFVTFCKENGVELIIINQDLDSATPWGKLALTMMASLAEFERATTVERLKINTRERLLSHGKINGAGEILGLVRDPNRKGYFVKNEKEIKLLHEVLKLYLDSISRTHALEMIEKNGIRISKGKKITRHMLDLILYNVNWRYRGKWYLDEGDEGVVEVDLDHGEVISSDLREKVLHKLEHARKNNIRKGVRNYVYLLSKLLQDKSGATFYGESPTSRGRMYRYYKCEKTKERLEVDKIEKAIERRLIGYFKRSETFEKIIVDCMKRRKQFTSEYEEQLREVKREHSELSQKSNALLDRLSTIDNLSEHAMKQITAMLDDLGRRKEFLEREQIRLKEIIENQDRPINVTETKSLIEKYATQFSKLERVQKRQIMEQVFEKIVVLDRHTLKIHLKSPPSEGDFLESAKNVSSGEVDGGT